MVAVAGGGRQEGRVDWRPTYKFGTGWRRRDRLNYDRGPKVRSDIDRCRPGPA
jgi:hypothetical protein